MVVVKEVTVTAAAVPELNPSPTDVAAVETM